MRSCVLFAVTVFCAFFGRGLALAAVGCVTSDVRIAEFSNWPAGTDPAAVSQRLSEQFLRTAPEAYKPVGCDTARLTDRPRSCGTATLSWRTDEKAG